MATTSITLTRSAQTPVLNQGVLSNYSFMVVASNAVGLVPNEIFKMNQRPLNPQTGSITADFVGVCTPYDITSLPIVAPIPPATQYRVATITVTYPTTIDGNTIWASIQSDTKLLLNSLIANNALNSVDVEVIQGDSTLLGNEMVLVTGGTLNLVTAGILDLVND